MHPVDDMPGGRSYWAANGTTTDGGASLLLGRTLAPERAAARTALHERLGIR